MEEIKDIIPEPVSGRMLIEIIKPQEQGPNIFGWEPPASNLGRIVKLPKGETELLPGMIVQFNTGVPPVILASSDTIVSIRYSEVYHTYSVK